MRTAFLQRLQLAIQLKHEAARRLVYGMLQIQFSFFFGSDCFAEGVNAVCMLAMLSAAWYEQPDVCDGPRPRYLQAIYLSHVQLRRRRL